ncbi:hypothetical protein ATANTOWER_004414, partial [Ataeniobius toweri]|nr:hypothetical protein [Ataeniobius toweri]
ADATLKRLDLTCSLQVADACIVTNGTPGKLCNETQEVCWYLVISALCAGPQTAALHLWHIQPELSLRCGGFHTAAGIHRPPVSQRHSFTERDTTTPRSPASQLRDSALLFASLQATVRSVKNCF